MQYNKAARPEKRRPQGKMTAKGVFIFIGVDEKQVDRAAPTRRGVGRLDNMLQMAALKNAVEQAFVAGLLRSNQPRPGLSAQPGCQQQRSSASASAQFQDCRVAGRRPRASQVEQRSGLLVRQLPGQSAGQTNPLPAIRISLQEVFSVGITHATSFGPRS